MFHKEFEKGGLMGFLGEIRRWHLVSIRKPCERLDTRGGFQLSWEIFTEIARSSSVKFKSVIVESIAQCGLMQGGRGMISSAR